MNDTVARIKQKLSILDVVSGYVKLQKAGKSYRGLSPFNKEKTPSFFVSPERGTYYCFSSNQGGDMFTFIEKMEGVDFKGALRILAEKAGVVIEYTSNHTEEKNKTDSLREVVLRAEHFFREHLTEKSEAYAYAKKRGLTEETIRSFGLGYAPLGWRTLLEALTQEGKGTQLLQEAGLIKEADEKRGTFYDRFRNRLIFPIRDIAGRTIAFTGRALDPKDQAKYLNSPETALFKKSEVLFGMHQAKDAIRTRDFSILVEGQFDVILMHQAGFTHTIALSGTALSPEHITILKRYSDNLLLALDADRAGLQASAKSALLALASGMRVKAILLPVGKDPADIVSENPEQMKELVKESVSIVEFFLKVLASREASPHRLLLLVEHIVLPLIKAIPSAMEREHFINIVARALDSTPEAIRESLIRAPLEPREIKESNLPEKPKTVVSEITREDMLQGILMVYPESPLAKRVKNEYARIIGNPHIKESLPEAVLFEVERSFPEPTQQDAADDMLKAFERNVLSSQFEIARKALKEAERAHDTAAISSAFAWCEEIKKRQSLLS